MNIETFFKITYGLYVISAVRENKLNGYISNSVFQVTAEPPQLAISCSKNNYSAQFLNDCKMFSVSVLAKDVRADIIGTFGYRSGKDINKFEKAVFFTTNAGTPVLTEDCLAWFECEKVQTFDVGSHLLIIGRVVENGTLKEQAEPLTYAHYRDVRKGKAPKNAPTYFDPLKLAAETAAFLNAKYSCNACNHVYYSVIGDPEHGIQPGTPYNKLPSNWVCPVCGADITEFSKIS